MVTRSFVVVLAALLAGSSLAGSSLAAAPRHAQDFPYCEAGVLEHNVRPDVGEEVVIRLDGGPLMTFTQTRRSD